MEDRSSRPGYVRRSDLAGSLDGHRISNLHGDIAARLGLDNVYGDHRERYPYVSLGDPAGRRPALIVLPDEPYPFSASDGPEMCPRHQVAGRRPQPDLVRALACHCP